MSAQEIDSIFGEEQTKQDELVAKARIQLEAMKEKTGESAKENMARRCMAVVRSPGDFCGAETIGHAAVMAVVIIDTTKTDMSGKQSIWNRGQAHDVQHVFD